MIEFNLKERTEELIQAEQLVVEGKFEEAYQIMDKFKERGVFTIRDVLLCNLLKVEIKFQQGLFKDVVRLANQTYKESIELRENAIAFDALNLETLALLSLNKVDDALEKIEEEEELLKILSQALPKEYKKRRAALEFLKAWLYSLKNDLDKAGTHSDSCIALLEEIGENRVLAYVLLASTGYLAIIKGDLDLALNNTKKGYVISKKINYKYGKARALLSKGVICGFKGDVDQCIIYHEESLTIFKELNSKYFIAQILNNLSESYRTIGDLERALESIELSIKYAKEQGNIRLAAAFHDFLIKILIDKGELEKAQKALQQLEQLNNQLNDKHINLQYLCDKALVLKTSSRSRNRIEAEDILKHIIKDESIQYECLIDAILYLCEILLVELRVSNDLSVLEEINIYTAKLLTIAEKNRSFILFAEIYFLKAKIALLTIDLKNARRFLTQAQRIAERFGYNQLVAKISMEHNDLINQLSIWDDLKKKEIPLSERIKFTGMEEQMKRLLQNRAVLTTPVKLEEVTIHREKRICLVCRGDVLGYMYTCQCDTIYCDKCTQALTEIENACWVCSTPIDITKPIKPYKEEETVEKESLTGKNKDPKRDDNSLKK